MGNDKDHLFSLKAEKGITAGYLTADPGNLKNISIVYSKGDFGNLLHEMKHAYQVSDGLLKPNTDGTVQGNVFLEVQAYERQLSYNGQLNFQLSPIPESDPNALINVALKSYGTANQVNTQFKATKFSHITPALIPRIMTESIGNTKLHPPIKN